VTGGAASDLDAVVLSVCRLPLDFHTIRSVSAVELVRRSGYRSARSGVTVERLAACLRDHPDWVDQWFDWSADNRSSPAWYVRESGDGRHELGFYEGPSSAAPVLFADRAEACATFVLRYLEGFADQ
jgi:hypothetical protein